MSDSLRPLRSLDWGSILTVVAMAIAGVVAFVVVREKQAAIIEDIVELRAADREHGDEISKIKEDRALEQKVNDLIIEVRLLRQEVEQINKAKRR